MVQKLKLVVNSNFKFKFVRSGFIMAIGVFNDGGSGAGHILVGILILTIALCFGAAACMDILLLTKVSLHKN
jgi:hypothetical protein